MLGGAVLIQRSLGFALLTSGAYLWQLSLESGLLAPVDVVLPQVGSTVQPASTFELLWPPTAKTAPVALAAMMCFLFVVKQIFFSGKEVLDNTIAATADGCTDIRSDCLCTVKSCDTVICTDEGRIKEAASHDALKRLAVKKVPDDEILKGWHRDFRETRHGKAMDAKRFEFLEQENAQLKQKVASMQVHLSKRFKQGHAMSSDALSRNLTSPDSKIGSKILSDSVLLSRWKRTAERTACDALVQEAPLQRSTSAPAELRGNLSKTKLHIPKLDAARDLFPKLPEVRQSYYW